MFDMINIFEVFLPQLLRYPNPTDPLNGEAAALLMREPRSYDAKVKGMNITRDATRETRYANCFLIEYVERYASNNPNDEDGEEGETDGEMSEVEDYQSDGDEEPAGAMEDI